MDSKFYYAENLSEIQMKCPPPETHEDIQNLKLCNLKTNAKMLDILKATKKALTINNKLISNILNIHTEPAIDINNNRRYRKHKSGPRAYIYYDNTPILKNTVQNTFNPPINLHEFEIIMQTPIHETYLPAIYRDVYPSTTQPNFISTFSALVDMYREKNIINQNQQHASSESNKQKNNYDKKKNNNNNNNKNNNYNNNNYNNNNNNKLRTQTDSSRHETQQYQNYQNLNQPNTTQNNSPETSATLNSTNDQQNNQMNMQVSSYSASSNQTSILSDELIPYNPNNKLQELILNRINALELKQNQADNQTALLANQTNLLATKIDSIETNITSSTNKLIEKQNNEMKSMLINFLGELKNKNS